MGDSPISLSSLFRNHLEVKCHKHNFGQSGCFCKGQSDLSLLCLCCPMGVAQWKWLPWRIKLVLMEKCVGFRPQHSQHESNTIRHSRLGSGWDFELVFDCTVRPMNPRSKSCHLKLGAGEGWQLSIQIYIYIYICGRSYHVEYAVKKDVSHISKPSNLFAIYISVLSTLRMRNTNILCCGDGS